MGNNTGEYLKNSVLDKRSHYQKGNVLLFIWSSIMGKLIWCEGKKRTVVTFGRGHGLTGKGLEGNF